MLASHVGKLTRDIVGQPGCRECWEGGGVGGGAFIGAFQTLYFSNFYFSKYLAILDWEQLVSTMMIFKAKCF